MFCGYPSVLLAPLFHSIYLTPGSVSWKLFGRIMPAHKKYDLDPYRHDIELRLAAAWTQDRVLTWLEEMMEEAPLRSR
jgi:hypothetical protein